VKEICFPDVPAPEVSIIVAVYGAEEWLFRCLQAVLDRTEPCYEVIVVDNASPAGLAARLVERTNARVISNPTNRGFGPANNQGANVARGPLLVFLNSDALVHDDWLTALRGALDADPRAAAVAPQFRNLDGTLQEAGALLFSSGYTQFYGMGDSADRPEYRFPREVDYASAACLAVLKPPPTTRTSTCPSRCAKRVTGFSTSRARSSLTCAGPRALPRSRRVSGDATTRSSSPDGKIV
jgi:GT2 family glycosyltransferase